jgi:hypothetical protein
LTDFGPRFGSVVSNETTTSGPMSATALSMSSASNTSATTGLAPAASIRGDLSDDRVSPMTS